MIDQVLAFFADKRAAWVQYHQIYVCNGSKPKMAISTDKDPYPSVLPTSCW